MSRPQSAREEAATTGVVPVDEVRDRRRLNELTQAHRPFLSNLARKLCRSSFDPEDLVQDVLLKTVAHYDRLPADVNHAAWMARVMHNLFIDRVRRRRPQDELDDRVPAPVPDEPTWWQRLSADDVRAALPQLPDELRRAFELFTFEGRSYKEISLALGVPVATVGTRVLRARRRLRALMGGPADE